MLPLFASTLAAEKRLSSMKNINRFLLPVFVEDPLQKWEQTDPFLPSFFPPPRSVKRPFFCPFPFERAQGLLVNSPEDPASLFLLVQEEDLGYNRITVRLVSQRFLFENRTLPPLRPPPLSRACR